MEMINVLKRLAELDAGNPNVIAEATQVALDECGPMGIMGGGMSHTPANISITAGSGPELSNMLKDIMSLAGVHKVEPHDMGIEHEPAALVAEPVAAVGPAASHGEIMRGVMDRMNPEMDDDEEGDEEEYEEQTDESWSNTPESPQPKKAFRANEFANMENQPGAGDHRIGTQPRATMEESLMAEWQQFVTENTGVTDYNPPSQGGDRKKLLAKYRETKKPEDAEAARIAGATQRELQDAKNGADVGMEESLTGEPVRGPAHIDPPKMTATRWSMILKNILDDESKDETLKTYGWRLNADGHALGQVVDYINKDYEDPETKKRIIDYIAKYAPNIKTIAYVQKSGPYGGQSDQRELDEISSDTAHAAAYAAKARTAALTDIAKKQSSSDPTKDPAVMASQAQQDKFYQYMRTAVDREREREFNRERGKLMSPAMRRKLGLGK